MDSRCSMRNITGNRKAEEEHVWISQELKVIRSTVYFPTEGCPWAPVLRSLYLVWGLFMDTESGCEETPCHSILGFQEGSYYWYLTTEHRWSLIFLEGANTPSRACFIFCRGVHRKSRSYEHSHRKGFASFSPERPSCIFPGRWPHKTT